MSEFKLKQEHLPILNSRFGMKRLMSTDTDYDYKKIIEKAELELRIEALQIELVKLQKWVIENKERVVVIFEGRDAAGKGGAIRKITSFINPRHYRAYALPKPSEEEKGEWYFQRYVKLLPEPGQIVFFDRSWYNRAMVEPVNDFCTKKEYKIFMKQVNHFERMITETGIRLLKIYLSITKEEQEERLENLRNDPMKKWKLTSVDEKAQDLWDKYTDYKERMFKKTDTKTCPWVILDASNKRKLRISAMEYILNSIPYKK
jgi:polyphosphate kinase 2